MMTKVITIVTLVLQIVVTFIATFCIYMVLAFLDNDFGFDGIFGLVFMQPIIGIILSCLTILICLIAGLPIRINNKLNRWRTTNFYVPIIGVALGLASLSLALLPVFRETVAADLDGVLTPKQVPNTILSIAGWMLTAFSSLHIYPPLPLTGKVKAALQSTSKASLVIAALLLFASCSNPKNGAGKAAILKADRKAPLGWVYLTIYRDSTFEFILTGVRTDKDIFKGKVDIRKDSLFFTYSDSIPKAGKTAVFNDKGVAYIDGEYPERLNISLTKLAK